MRREAIRRGSEGSLVMFTASLPDGLELYGVEAHAAARELVRELVGGWPAWFKVEEGAHGILHVHILTVVEAVPAARAAFPDLHGVPVWNLRGVLAYLSKPAIGSAARSDWNRRPDDVALREAAERWCSARRGLPEGRSRLPVCSGVVNLPNQRPASLSPVLLLAVLVEVLSAAERRLVKLAASLTERTERPRKAGVRPAGTGHSDMRRRHRYGRPVSRAAYRRFEPVGHARPPPRKSRVRLVNGPSGTRRLISQLTLSSEPPPRYHRRGPDEATKRKVLQVHLIPYVLDSSDHRRHCRSGRGRWCFLRFPKGKERCGGSHYERWCRSRRSPPAGGLHHERWSSTAARALRAGLPGAR